MRGFRQPQGKNRKRVSVHTGITPDLIHDLGEDPSPQGGSHLAREIGNLKETHLLIVKEFHQVLGEEHVATLTIKDYLPVASSWCGERTHSGSNAVPTDRERTTSVAQSLG